MTLRIAVVSGGRADYGLLSEPMRLLAADPRFALRVIATGQHLATEGSESLKQIETDGFAIADRVDVLLASDSALAVCKTTGLAVVGLAEALARDPPDLVLLLGDRYEILAAAVAAHLLRIPIAHIAGGDITEGAIDDALRHAITKLSHIHFVTNEDAGRRVRQLGEDPRRVHVVGSPGLDRIRTTKIPDRETFFRELGIAMRPRNIVITFHPVTASATTMAEATELLAALDEFDQDVGLIFTGVNADTEGRTLEALISSFCATHDNASLHRTLGARLYFAALTHCDMIVGNSSSGLYEAPSFGIPTINVGERQTGRIKAASVIDTVPERRAIAAAMSKGFALDCTGIANPYGDGRASERIMAVLGNIEDPRTLLVKSFNTFP